MSKITKMIGEMVGSGRKVQVKEGVEFAMRGNSVGMGFGTEYRYGLMLQTKLTLSDMESEAVKFDVGQMVKDVAARQIAEALYAEFREPIRLIYEMIANRQNAEAMVALMALEKSMFGL